MPEYLLQVNLRWKTILLGHNGVQISAANHPESGISKEGDKCHQLRNAFNHHIKAALCMFVPGKEMTFDEDGILSKSYYNPVGQCIYSKPDKYWIDFFIPANASSGHNFIILIFIRKNENNISMPQDRWHLPRTQKAVMNAIVSTRLYKDPDGPWIQRVENG